MPFYWKNYHNKLCFKKAQGAGDDTAMNGVQFTCSKVGGTLRFVATFSYAFLHFLVIMIVIRKILPGLAEI